MKLSIITPVYNESENLKQLYEELAGVLFSLKEDYEIIAVNDGSADDSFLVLQEIAKKDKNFKVINFTENKGQTAALLAGIDNSSGDIIITMDSDLENDPADIIKLIAKLDEGYDVVSGWRKDRWKGQWLTRKMPSQVANSIISKITNLKLKDYGCTLKVYRREVIVDVPLYGEMHRFIPAYAHWKKAKVGEMEVSFRPRQSGKSSYGISRVFKVLLDLIIIKFLNKYMARPMHFFGGAGFVIFFLGALSGVASVVLKIFEIRDFVSTPLPILTVLLIMVGVQLVAMGVVAEMMMRTYFEASGKKTYHIKEKINLE